MVMVEWFSEVYIEFQFWVQELYIWDLKQARKV